MKSSICKVKGCPNEGKYCRNHIGLIIPEKKGIEKVSEKRKQEEKEYTKKRKAYLALHADCEAKIEGVCTGKANEIHHKRGRTGENYLNIKYFLAVCRGCHEAITRNSRWAIDHGFSESRHSKINKQ